MALSMILPEARADERTLLHLGGDHSRLIDLSRTAVAVGNLAAIDEIVADYEASGFTVVHRRDRIARPSRLGFSDLRVYLRGPNDYISALRLIPMAMLEAQATGLRLNLARAALLMAGRSKARYIVLVSDLFNFEEPDGLTCIDGFAAVDDALLYARARQQDSIEVLRGHAENDALYTEWLSLGEATAVVDVEDPQSLVMVAEEVGGMIDEPPEATSLEWREIGERAGVTANAVGEFVIGPELERIVDAHQEWRRSQRVPMNDELLEEALRNDCSPSTPEGPMRDPLGKGIDWRGRPITGSILKFTRPQAQFADENADDSAASDQGRADLRGVSFFNVWDGQVGPVIDGLNLEGAVLDECVLAGYTTYRAGFEHASMVGARLRGLFSRDTSFRFADLTEADLSNAQFRSADLQQAVLDGADLRGARFFHSYFTGATLRDANLSGANLVDTDFTDADLSGADLRGADLRWCRLVRTRLEGAKLDGSRVFGISAWSVRTDGQTSQRGLVITEEGSGVTVDRLDIAQLLHLVIDNRNITHVLDTLTSRLVLILGRFSAPRMEVLRFIGRIVEKHGLVPVIFDFDVPNQRDVTETVRALAHLSALLIADLTDPMSVPQELTTVVPTLPSLPVIPVIDGGGDPYSMFPHFLRYPWVLPPLSYANLEELERGLHARITAIASVADAKKTDRADLI